MVVDLHRDNIGTRVTNDAGKNMLRDEFTDSK